MSKSKGNVVLPDSYIEKYGADTLRCYLMFCGRFTQGGDFRDSGIEGMYRFLKRVWRLVVNAGPVAGSSHSTSSARGKSKRDQNDSVSLRALSGTPSARTTRLSEQDLYLMHKTIKRVTEDIESLDYNTAIAAIMEWVNALEERMATIDNLQLTTDKNKSNVRGQMSNVSLEEIQTLLLLLAPFAPHMTEELWQRLRRSQIATDKETDLRRSVQISFSNPRESIHLQPWPKYDAKLAEAQEIVLVVEVNGKVRGKIAVTRGIGREEAQKLALASEKVTKYLPKGKPKKVIFVPDRLINFVV